MKTQQLNEESKKYYGAFKNQVFEIKAVIDFTCRLSRDRKKERKMKVLP
jgi:hypothetical protein